MQRTPFNAIDEAIHHADGPREPWSIGLECRLPPGLEESRVRDAVQAAMARHPMARARRAPAADAHFAYRWEIPERAERDPLYVVEVRDAAARRDARERVLSLQIPVETSPPFRAVLVRGGVQGGEQGDALILNVSHVACDGVGGVRLLASILRALAGDADPTPDVDPLAVRNLFLENAARRPDEGLRRASALFGRLRDTLRPPTRVAPLGGRDGEGYRLVYRRFDRARTQALRAGGDGATLNDRLLAALHGTIERWNREQGVACDRIGVMMPVNLRPRSRWREVVGNFSLGITVSTLPEDRADPATLLAAVSARTRERKQPAAAASLLDLLAGSAALPVGLKRRAAELVARSADRLVDTAVLTNLGDLPPLSSLDEALGDDAELWLTAPAPLPMGVSIGAVRMAGRLHLVMSCSPRVFDRAAAESFFDLYGVTLAEVPAAAHAVPTPVESEVRA